LTEYPIEWSNPTCACVVLLPLGQGPSKEGKFKVQCKDHNTTVETYVHCIRFKQSDEATREAERIKPEFQER